jgi:predicted DsbA family dithiol-disulfide isomerase
LKQFAEQLGLDTESFSQCLDSGKYASVVQSETQTAQAIGVRSTPSFLVNGQPLIGALPFEDFERIIEAER